MGNDISYGLAQDQSTQHYKQFLMFSEHNYFLWSYNKEQLSKQAQSNADLERVCSGVGVPSVLQSDLK